MFSATNFSDAKELLPIQDGTPTYLWIEARILGVHHNVRAWVGIESSVALLS